MYKNWFRHSFPHTPMLQSRTKVSILTATSLNNVLSWQIIKISKIISSCFQGFPTLYWLPKNTKTPVSYNGGRELDDFVKYISEKATDELKGWDRKGKEKKTEL